MTAEPLVHVVDDDPAVARALETILSSIGLHSRCYGSAQDFLAAYNPDQPGCAILDVRMPGMSGLELQERLAGDAVCIPAIVISGHADVRMAVDAMQGGAVMFLEKPLRANELCEHVQKAIDLDARRREDYRRRRQAQEQIEQLTDKEREVMRMAAAGKTNKEMAAELGLSLRAIEDRRARMMKKLDIKSLTELIQLVDAAKAMIRGPLQSQ